MYEMTKGLQKVPCSQLMMFALQPCYRSNSAHNATDRVNSIMEVLKI